MWKGVYRISQWERVFHVQAGRPEFEILVKTWASLPATNTLLFWWAGAGGLLGLACHHSPTHSVRDPVLKNWRVMDTQTVPLASSWTCISSHICVHSNTHTHELCAKRSMQTLCMSWAWWHRPLITATERWGQVDLCELGDKSSLHSKFQVNHGCAVRPCLRINKWFYLGWNNSSVVKEHLLLL